MKRVQYNAKLWTEWYIRNKILDKELEPENARVCSYVCEDAYNRGVEDTIRALDECGLHKSIIVRIIRKVRRYLDKEV